MSLSVAIATHNEEKNIEACLESVYDWVHEIVIVDGESTDQTVEVVEEFQQSRLRQDSGEPKKIHLFHEKNPPMFHINKQKAIERCTKDWILQLDADEIITTELKDEIRSVVSSKEQASSSKQISNLQSPIAYWIPRLNYFLGRPLKKGGQYPDYTIRLYKNGVARFPRKSVHEQAEIRRIDVPRSEKTRDRDHIGHLKSPLLHFPYPNFDSYLEKWSRYGILEAEILYEQGVRPSIVNHFKYFIIFPKWWFLKTFFRHKGFMDGFAGFTFALFSAIRYWVSYIKLFELSSSKK